jgi:hypothetical protein
MSPGGEQKGVDLRIGLDLTTHARNRVVDVMYLVSGDDDLTEAVEEAQGHGVQVIVLAAPDTEGRAHAVSRNLQREADGVLVIDPLIIDTAVTRRLAPPLVPTAPVAPAEPLVAPDPRSPSPADLARPRRIRDLAAVKSSPVRTGNSLVYTSDATSAHTGVEEGLTPDLLRAIDEVSSRVARSWLATATPEELGEARIERPYVPAGPDAALLTDLSGALNTYYIDDSTRRTLRDHFWLTVDEQLASSS